MVETKKDIFLMHLAGSCWEGGGARSPGTSLALFPLSHSPGAHSLGMTFDKKDSKIESSGLKEITAGKALKCS